MCQKQYNGDFDGTGSNGKHKKVMEAEAEELLYEGQSLQLRYIHIKPAFLPLTFVNIVSQTLTVSVTCSFNSTYFKTRY